MTNWMSGARYVFQHSNNTLKSITLALFVSSLGLLPPYHPRALSCLFHFLFFLVQQFDSIMSACACECAARSSRFNGAEVVWLFSFSCKRKISRCFELVLGKRHFQDKLYVIVYPLSFSRFLITCARVYNMHGGRLRRDCQVTFALDLNIIYWWIKTQFKRLAGAAMQ